MAKIAKNKKVNIQALNKASAKFNEYKTIRVMDGEFDVVIPVYFSNTQIGNFLNELIQWTQKLEELDVSKKDFNLVFMGLMIKSFSDVEFPKKVENTIDFINKLHDTGILMEIIEEFGQENLENLNKSMQNLINLNLDIDDYKLPIELLGSN